MNKFTKVIGLVGLCSILAFGTTGCTTAKAAEPAGPVRSIQVQEIEETSMPITQHYIGVVDAKDQIEYSFKSSGRLGEIHVEDGQAVTKGDLIAKLDIQDLNFQAEAARAQYAAAQL
ncbi:efflux RND transporter periplasmic adaptor subunit, partial [Aduncisulcus paluster]